MTQYWYMVWRTRLDQYFLITMESLGQGSRVCEIHGNFDTLSDVYEHLGLWRNWHFFSDKRGNITGIRPMGETKLICPCNCDKLDVKW